MSKMSSLSKLMIDGSIEDDQEIISTHVVDFYKSLYDEPCMTRLEGVELKIYFCG